MDEERHAVHRSATTRASLFMVPRSTAGSPQRRRPDRAAPGARAPASRLLVEFGGHESAIAIGQFGTRSDRAEDLHHRLARLLAGADPRALSQDVEEDLERALVLLRGREGLAQRQPRLEVVGIFARAAFGLLHAVAGELQAQHCNLLLEPLGVVGK